MSALWRSEASGKQRVRITITITELLSRFKRGGNGYGDDDAFYVICVDVLQSMPARFQHARVRSSV